MKLAAQVKKEQVRLVVQAKKKQAGLSVQAKKEQAKLAEQAKKEQVSSDGIESNFYTYNGSYFDILKVMLSITV